MAVTISSTAFNQDAAGAKRAVNRRPLGAGRGRRAHVLLSIE